MAANVAGMEGRFTLLEWLRLRYALHALLFALLFVGGVRLGAALEYRGVSMWFVVLLAAIPALILLARPDTRLGRLELGRMHLLLFGLAGALALMAMANADNRDELRVQGAADRLLALHRVSPARAAAALRGKSSRELSMLERRLPQLVEPEIRRRRMLVDAEEKERLRRQNEWQQSPVGWFVGFFGWMLNPRH